MIGFEEIYTVREIELVFRLEVAKFKKKVSGRETVRERQIFLKCLGSRYVSCNGDEAFDRKTTGKRH